MKSKKGNVRSEQLLPQYLVREVAKWLKSDWMLATKILSKKNSSSNIRDKYVAKSLKDKVNSHFEELYKKNLVKRERGRPKKITKKLIKISLRDIAEIKETLSNELGKPVRLITYKMAALRYANEAAHDKENKAAIRRLAIKIEGNIKYLKRLEKIGK